MNPLFYILSSCKLLEAGLRNNCFFLFFFLKTPHQKLRTCALSAMTSSSVGKRLFAFGGSFDQPQTRIFRGFPRSKAFSRLFEIKNPFTSFRT